MARGKIGLQMQLLDRIEDTGSIVIANTPEQFAAQIKAEFDVYKNVVDTQKLRLD